MLPTQGLREWNPCMLGSANTVLCQVRGCGGEAPTRISEHCSVSGLGWPIFFKLQFFKSRFICTWLMYVLIAFGKTQNIQNQIIYRKLFVFSDFIQLKILKKQMKFRLKWCRTKVFLDPNILKDHHQFSQNFPSLLPTEIKLYWVR